METLYREHTVSKELPWHYQSKGGRYTKFYEDLETENPRMWHIWTLPEGVRPENVRSAVLSYGRREGKTIQTSINGNRFAARIVA